MSRRIRIIGLSTTERSLLDHPLEEHRFAAIAASQPGDDARIAAVEAADILTPPQEEVPNAVCRQGCR